MSSALEAFGLGPETIRFLDPPARLFSILDFKNSDDRNRWGDTTEDTREATVALAGISIDGSQTWRRLVQNGLAEKLCKASLECPSDGNSIVWGTGVLMPLTTFDTPLRIGDPSSPTTKSIMDALKRYWRPITQRIWKEPSLLFSQKEDEGTFVQRTTLPHAFHYLVEDSTFVASLDDEDDVTLSLFVKIWWHCTTEVDNSFVMEAVRWFLRHTKETPVSVEPHSRSLLYRIVRGLHPASVSECSQFLSRLLRIKGRTSGDIYEMLKELTWVVQKDIVVRPYHHDDDDDEKWITLLAWGLKPREAALLRPGDSAWPQPSPYPTDPRDRFFRSALPLHERATHCAVFRAMMLTEPFWSFQFDLIRAGVESEGSASQKTLYMFASSMLISEREHGGVELVRLVTAWLKAGLFDTLDALYPIIKTHEREIIYYLFRALQLVLKAKTLPHSERNGLSIPTKPPPAHLLRSALDFDIDNSKDLAKSKPQLGQTIQIRLPPTGFPPSISNYEGGRRWLWVALYILQARKASVCRRHECAEAGRLRCKACKTRYCGAECQKLDWRDHRLICGLHIVVDDVDVDENSPLSNPAYNATMLTVTYPSREKK